MDMNDVKQLLNQLTDKVMYLVEKDQYHEKMYQTVLRKKDEEVAKTKIAYQKLLMDLRNINSKNENLRDQLKDRDENIRILTEDIEKLNLWKDKISKIINES